MTSSTSITLLFGDCLATTVMSKKKFSKEKFKVFHPGKYRWFSTFTKRYHGYWIEATDYRF